MNPRTAFWGEISILDPFGGAKLRPSGRCLKRRSGLTLSLSATLGALSLSKGKSQHLCWGVEGLTLSIFHESIRLTPGFFPLTSLENKTARLNLFWFNMKQSVMSDIDFLQIIPSMV
jgi:hypothetical protein